MIKQSFQTVPSFKLVGMTARTKTMNELNPLTAKIGPLFQQYVMGQMFEKINARKKPGTTYCVYTQYESDYTGEYTYFIGEEVTHFEGVSDPFETLTIPEQYCMVFTTGPGVMPQVCLQAWQHIWALTPAQLQGGRAYVADFEVYDARAKNPLEATLDIYVGVRQG